MEPWSLAIPIISAGAGAAATWLTTRHQWSQALRKERLEAARKVVSHVTDVQFAIAEELEERSSGNAAVFDDIDFKKAALVKAVSDSRLLVGEDIYRRLGNVLEAIDRDADCLGDDGWSMVGFTWRAMEDFMVALGALIPGARVQVPTSATFQITSNRLIPYGGMPPQTMEPGQQTPPELAESTGGTPFAEGIREWLRKRGPSHT